MYHKTAILSKKLLVLQYKCTENGTGIPGKETENLYKFLRDFV